MEANPEVMPAVATPPPRPQATQNVKPGPSDSATKAPSLPRATNGLRISEDPMRRTDRYRLVMPWSSRV